MDQFSNKQQDIFDLIEAAKQLLILQEENTVDLYVGIHQLLSSAQQHCQWLHDYVFNWPMPASFTFHLANESRSNSCTKWILGVNITCNHKGLFQVTVACINCLSWHHITISITGKISCARRFQPLFYSKCAIGIRPYFIRVVRPFILATCYQKRKKNATYQCSHKYPFG